MKKASKSEIVLQTPAKLNLFFRVLNKREDGYHNIASLNIKIGLFDELSIQKSKIDRFTCDQRDLSNDDNLVVKARNLFRKEAKMSDPFAIHLIKKIPVQAGLGGGSSNAASTLLGLNELCGFPLTKQQLFPLAASLGSDVPFFLMQKPAYCTGRGEILKEVEYSISSPLWVAKPIDLALSTPKVYQNCIPNEVSTLDPESILANFSHSPLFINDLEPAAFRLLPELGKIKQDLQRLGFEHVCMTGSGTAFFCIGNVKNPIRPGICFFPVVIGWA